MVGVKWPVRYHVNMPKDVTSTSDQPGEKTTSTDPTDTSDQALVDLLKRLKATVDANEIRQLSDRIERIIFHKQFRNA